MTLERFDTVQQERIDRECVSRLIDSLEAIERQVILLRSDLRDSNDGLDTDSRLAGILRTISEALA